MAKKTHQFRTVHSDGHSDSDRQIIPGVTYREADEYLLSLNFRQGIEAALLGAAFMLRLKRTLMENEKAKTAPSDASL